MNEFKIGDEVVDVASAEEGRIVSIDVDDDLDADDGRRIWIRLTGSGLQILRGESEIELA